MTINVWIEPGAPLRAVVTERPHWAAWFLFGWDERVYTAVPDGRGWWVELRDGLPSRPMGLRVGWAIDRAMKRRAEEEQLRTAAGPQLVAGIRRRR